MTVEGVGWFRGKGKLLLTDRSWVRLSIASDRYLLNIKWKVNGKGQSYKTTILLCDNSIKIKKFRCFLPCCPERYVCCRQNKVLIGQMKIFKTVSPFAPLS